MAQGLKAQRRWAWGGVPTPLPVPSTEKSKISSGSVILVRSGWNKLLGLLRNLQNAQIPTCIG